MVAIKKAKIKKKLEKYLSYLVDDSGIILHPAGFFEELSRKLTSS